MGHTSEARLRHRRRKRKREQEKRDRERLEQHGKPCTYCPCLMSIEVGARYPTRDHVEPRSRGGKITVWACYTCNAVKRDMSVDEWANYRADHDFWWIAGRRARNAANWTPRTRIDNLPSIPSETGPEAEDTEDALTV